MKIPKRFILTWKDENIPEKWKPCIESIKEHMPDYEIFLATDKMNRDMIKDNFPDFLKIYDSFPYPIQRADAARYGWLHLKGGIYMDLDYKLKGDLGHLFKESSLYFIMSSNTKRYITNSLMASVPGHSIWLEVFEEMKKDLPWWAFGRHLHVILSTGPGMLDKVVRESKHTYTVLPGSVVNPYNICDTCFNKESLTEPLEGQSWVTWDTMLYGSWYCYSYYWASFAILFILLVFVLFWVFRYR